MKLALSADHSAKPDAISSPMLDSPSRWTIWASLKGDWTDLCRCRINPMPVAENFYDPLCGLVSPYHFGNGEVLFCCCRDAEANIP